MVATNHYQDSPSERLLADLTDAAYRVALKHGIKGTFIDVELDLWAALRGVLAGESLAGGDLGEELSPLTPNTAFWRSTKPFTENVPCRV